MAFVAAVNEASLKSRYLGCLLGGAVGDALGAPIEFLSLAEIRRRFGPDGLRDYAPAYGRVGAITDDTQMTLFTAEGLLRAPVRHSDRGICHPTSVIHHAYLRWLKTQGRDPRDEIAMDGWLIGVRGLWSERAPGNTCFSALLSADRASLVARNDSKGCGGIMRVAPVGLIPHAGESSALPARRRAARMVTRPESWRQDFLHGSSISWSTARIWKPLWMQRRRSS